MSKFKHKGFQVFDVVHFSYFLFHDLVCLFKSYCIVIYQKSQKKEKLKKSKFFLEVSRNYTEILILPNNIRIKNFIFVRKKIYVA